MSAFIVSFLVGLVCCWLGVSNMRGNISSIHSYHRKRVSEEDRLPFGKMVGLGTLLIGIGVMAFSLLAAVTLYTEREVFLQVGNVILLITIALGLILSFRAMIKYNKGIF